MIGRSQGAGKADLEATEAAWRRQFT